MDIKKELISSLHISPAEASLYLVALEKNHNTVTDLATAAKMPRTAVYGPLKKLIERGFVSEIKLGKRTHYQALPVNQLSLLLDRDKNLLQQIAAQLEQRISVPQDNMEVRHFRGAHGVLTAADILFDLTPVGSTFSSVEHVNLILEKWKEEVFDDYREKRLEKHMAAKVINPSYEMTPWLQERLDKQKEEKIEYLIVSEEDYPRPAGFITNGKHLLIMTYRPVPSATLIFNEDVAKTYESMHKMIWDRYKG
ncbi:MAG: helix-turn-helix domain-containing protein [Patescibacteria group bacterium]